MKIAVLISGGVDSSVALALLKNQGHDVTAFYLKIWLEDELSYLGQCPWEDDLSYITNVCEQFKVPLEVVPLQKEYWDLVVAYAITEVKAGRTPSPDLLCNQHIKFGAFYDKIDSSFEKVATGHYAQTREENGIVKLVCAADTFKDQTYFLSRLTQKQLSRAIFPIGHLKKNEVRQLAQEFKLPNSERKDSQGICFLGKIKFSDFIKHHLGIKTGNLIDIDTNQIVGTHEGFWYYTIGQRKGIGLSGGPWYVVSKDVEKNIVYLSRNYHDPEKKRNSFIVNAFNWIEAPPRQSQVIKVKIRHGELLYDATITFTDYHKAEATITLVGNDQGIAPGQFAVFYEDDRCLGSGVIKEEGLK